MNNYSLFFTLFFISFCLALISGNLLGAEKLLINSLIESYTNEQISEIIKFQGKLKWIGYFVFPILLLIKISTIAAILDVGCFFFEKEIKYKKLFNIVAKAEFIFLLVVVFKTIWFYLFQTNYNLEDLQYFYPLSALNIIGYEGLQPWLIYPSQVLNLFELTYCVILAYLIGKELNENTVKGLSIVASSYGVGLLIWVISVMFFTLNIS